jgi:hypothetical protein
MFLLKNNTFMDTNRTYFFIDEGKKEGSLPTGKKVLMQAQTDANTKVREDQRYSPIARIFQLGREKTYVTYEDILRFIPQPEQDLELVDRVFGVLLCANIPYGEDAEYLMENEEIDLGLS